MPSPTVAVIGAGASGTLLALNLLRHSPAGTRITLIERHASFGPGLAYATANPNHLLNVPAGRMSAFADQPRHFLDWLQQQPEQLLQGLQPTEAAFVPRRLYGAYLRHLLNSSALALETLHDEVVAIEQATRHAVLRLASGQVLSADVAVLANGNDRPVAPGVPGLRTSPQWRSDPWNADAFSSLDPRAAVLLIGTGLTMVDAVVTLLDQGHSGPIHAVSRRGLLPRRHAPTTVPPLQLPLRFDIRELTRFVRQQAAASDGDWRGVIDALRPVTQEIWQTLSGVEKAQFLRHLRPWWDVHRHRMPPAITDRIDNARASGQLQILAGRLVHCSAGELQIGHRDGTDTMLRVARVVNCTGPCTDAARSDDRLLQALLRSGLARPDACRLGLDVTASGALRNRSGVISQSLFALGPLTRGAFWEITAIPDIRRQCETLALHLSDLLHAQARQRLRTLSYA